MASERLAKLESVVRDNPNLSEANRRELLDLVAGLRTEMASLADAHANQIAVGAEAAVQASISEQPQATAAVEGLATSVREFEATHPRLVEIVDQLALTLSNMGI